jgi:2-polyprenyl-3-methyl-5-hydroxy-6-metoxy-1,4-benzoquinol methylase
MAKQPLKRNCPVCGHTEAEALFVPKSSPGPVVRCPRCGMVFVSLIQNARSLIFDGPVADEAQQRMLTSADLGDLADCWESSMLPSKEAEWPALRENAIDHLQRIESTLQKSERKILDFGSGWGFFLAAAKERGWDAYGIEPLPGHSVYARAQFKLPIITDTLREGMFPPGSFNAIASFQVFEHIPDPSRDIATLCQMLAPNGIMLIEVPNVATRAVSLLKDKHRHFTVDHLNFFSAKTLSDLMQRNGLTVLAHYTPTRRMSYRHLVTYWGARVLPHRAAHAAQTTVQRLGLWEKSLRMNVGDIVAVLAQKTRQ